MDYRITLEYFDITDMVKRRDPWKPMGEVEFDGDLAEVSKSLEVALQDAEQRLGQNSDEAALFRSLITLSR